MTEDYSDYDEPRGPRWAVLGWAVAVVCGLVVGVVVIGRLVPERTEARPADIVAVPGDAPSIAAENAVVLLPAGTPASAAGSKPVPEGDGGWDGGRIRIPSLGIDSAVAEGVDLASLDSGVGHWPGTAMPGQPGNLVLAGHRTTHGAPFRRLDELAVGDGVVVGTGSRSTTYRVTGTEIVSPEQLDVARPTAEPTATLFACHPPGSARQRIVVRLVAIP